MLTIFIVGIAVVGGALTYNFLSEDLPPSDGKVEDCLVQFVDYDGTLLSKASYAVNDKIENIPTPIRASTEYYDYTFNGWDTEIPDVVTSNITLKATYTRTDRVYTVSFVDYNGMELSSKTYSFGESIIVPDDPVRAKDQKYSYTFSRWSPALSPNVTSSVEYVAIYEAFSGSVPIDLSYTIQFIDWNGALISSEVYKEGAIVVMPMAPTRAPSVQYDYTFTGWDQNVTHYACADAVYTAVYESILRTFTVSFLDWDKVTIAENEYTYGSEVIIPSDPIRYSDGSFDYTFKSWSPSVIQTVTKNAVYTATYYQSVSVPEIDDHAEDFKGYAIDSYVDPNDFTKAFYGMTENYIFFKVGTVSGSVIESSIASKANHISYTSTEITGESFSESISESMSTAIREASVTQEYTHGISFEYSHDIFLVSSFGAEINSSYTSVHDPGERTTTNVNEWSKGTTTSYSSETSFSITYDIEPEEGYWYRVALVYTYDIIFGIRVDDFTTGDYSTTWISKYTTPTLELQKSIDPTFNKYTSASYPNCYMSDELVRKAIQFYYSDIELLDVTFDLQNISNQKIVAKAVSGYEYSGLDEQPVRKGYSFLGWATSPSSTEFVQFPVTLTKNITYYAVWTDLEHEGWTEIYTAEQLAAIGNDADSLSGKYVLRSDIDLSSYENWIPIGQNDIFTGILDGDGHKITNMSITKYPTASFGISIPYGGLFSILSGTVKNLIIESVVINASSGLLPGYCGSIAGQIVDGTIQNVEIKSGTIKNNPLFSNNSETGAICGKTSGNCIITNVVVDNEVTVYGYSSFIGSSTGTLCLEYCVSYATIKQSCAYSKDATIHIGFIAEIDGILKANYCYNGESYSISNSGSGKLTVIADGVAGTYTTTDEWSLTSFLFKKSTHNSEIEGASAVMSIGETVLINNGWDLNDSNCYLTLEAGVLKLKWN